MSSFTSDFELENVAAGPDPFRLSAVADREDLEAIVLLFQRDYHCVKCRRQVQAVADRYEEFEARDALVVSVLPESPERTASWQERYDLPFPLLADPSTDVGDEFDQPTRFGTLGSLSDFVGRMPLALVLDTGERYVIPRPWSVARAPRHGLEIVRSVEQHRRAVRVVAVERAGGCRADSGSGAGGEGDVVLIRASPRGLD